jgi:hypothetical protein
LLSTLPGDFKETVFFKIEWGVIFLPPGEQFTNLIFWISLEKKYALCVYRDNAKRQIKP